MHPRAEQIRWAKLTVEDRPGIIKPFMVPTKMKNQVRISQPFVDLEYFPDGKTLVGGTQWAITVQRPGLAQPLIIAKDEQKAAAEMVKVAEAQKNGAAPVAAPAPAPAANGAAPAQLSGWGRRRRWR